MKDLPTVKIIATEKPEIKNYGISPLNQILNDKRSELPDNLKTRLKSEIDKIPVPPDYLKMGDNFLLVSFGEYIRLMEQQIRYEQFDEAMKTAAEIAVKMAVFAMEGRG